MPSAVPASTSAAAPGPQSLDGAAASGHGTSAQQDGQEGMLHSGGAGPSRGALVPLLTDGLGATDALQTDAQPDGGTTAAAAEQVTKVRRWNGSLTESAS